jgi:ubiquinone biosynthesis protein UbiJ
MFNLKDLILFPANSAINLALKLDSESLDKLSRHAGKILAMHITSFDQTIFMSINVDGVNLSFSNDAEVKTTLSGTPFAYLRLLSQEQKGTLSDIKLNGDPHFAQDIQAIFKGLSIDWEEQLSKFVGDTAAHHIGKTSKEVQEWSAETRQNFYQNLTAFLQQETAQLPTRAAVNDFLNAVDELRNDVERISVRIKHLKK